MSTSPPTTSAAGAPAPVRVGGRRRWLLAVALVAIALLLSAAVVVWRSTHDGRRDLASDAAVAASSTEHGFAARDIVTSGSASSPGKAWQSAGETSGAWVELSWPRSHDLHRITVVRNPLDEPGATDGFLAFGDGSFLQVTLSTTAPETVVPIAPRDVDRVRFTISGVSPGAQHVNIAEILVSSATDDGDVVVDDTADGNAAPAARVTQSGGAADAGTLVDGSGAPGAGGVGAGWAVDRPAGAWVQLDWDSPRELSSMALVGSPGSAADLRSATLTFDGGARLPVGAVLDDADRATILGFMPRVTRSVRLSIDGVNGTGPLTLAELRTYARGATPVRAVGLGPGQASGQVGTTAPVACAPPTGAASQAPITVRCPTADSRVDGRVDVAVSVASGYTEVTAVPWPGDEAQPSGSVARSTPDPTGAATLTVDLGPLPPGPLTVRLEATGPGKERVAVDFPLYRLGPAPVVDLPPAAPALGRTLAYAEEFEQPISLSRTGAGADYTAAKPVHDGVQNFGDAIFADPARGVDNVGVVDNRYLRIGVEPTPAGYPTAQGGGPAHVGGLLASARPGGSGFSAQYGYFEARMLASAGPGTWPAFWMLPSDNLVSPTPVVAEIDAVELYGHNPTGACHSTHEYKDGRDGGVANCGQRYATDRSALSWHTYGISITPTGNTFYIDGQVVATAPQVDGGGAPMFFLVDLALGGGWPVDLAAVQDRAALYVDYVRVYV